MYNNCEHNLAKIRYEEYLREADEARLARQATGGRNLLLEHTLLWAGERLVAVGENLKQIAGRKAASVYMQSIASAQRMQS